MSELKKCRACGVDVPSNAPFGHCPKCLLELGLGSAPPTNPPAAPASVTEAPGDYIDRYKLLQKIGEGGCGVVYMADQEEPIRRRVALKVIKLGMDTRAVIARFEAERQALAMMDHPNIAKVLDVGQTTAGRPFFVMELVKGVRITEYCDKNNLTTRERLNLFTHVCHAIQHAHQKGIIHRDIKPSNILVTLHDGVPVPKVIDFGIAKAINQQRLTDLTLFTAFGQFIGTPAYMSPEQAEMSGLDIDTRCDIYALGVLLYELLVGKTPFDGKQLLQAGLDEMRRIIREQEPVRPSSHLSTLAAADLTVVARHRQCEPARLSHLVRGDLDWIVMKCLEKDRTRRYETSSGLAADIQRHLNDEAVLASPPSKLYRFQKTVRRNKLAFAAAGAVTIALVIGLAVSSWLYFKESKARERAETAEKDQARLRQEAEAEAEKSHQIAAFLEDMLKGVKPSVALGRDTIMLHEIADKAATRLSRELKSQPLVEADLLNLLGDVYLELGEYGKAEAMAQEALAIRRKLFGNEHLQVAASLNNLAGVIQKQGKMAEAELMIHEALAMSRKLGGNEHSQVAASLNNLAVVLQDQGKLAEAETIIREALEMKRKLLGDENLDVASSLNNLAKVLYAQNKLTEAEVRFREALTMTKKVLTNEHPQVATSLYNLGTFLQQQGKLAEAEIKHREALTMRKKLLGNEHPHVTDSLINLALNLEAQDKRAQAESLLLEANGLVQQNNQVPAKQKRDVIERLVNFYFTWAAAAPGSGKMQKALEWREKLIEFDKTAKEREALAGLRVRAEGGDAQSQYELGAAFYAGERGAATNHAEAVKWFRKAGEQGHAPAQYNLGLCYANGQGVAKDEAEAVKWLWKAAEQNQTDAQVHLGLHYVTGDGVTKDEAQAVHWLQKAAERNNVDGQVNLAKCYASGIGVKKNATQALKWYRRAADQNHSQAQNGLAWFLATSEDPAIRDGSNAVLFAERAVAATHRSDPVTLDTLAAALAEIGQFEQAVSTEREAIALLKTEEEKKDYTSRLKLYKAKAPYRAKD